MSFFLCKLNAPRSTFAMDMSDEERQLMQAHSTYWRQLLAEGKAVVFGPVGDPAGVWGVVIAEVADRAEMDVLTSEDPVITARRSFSYDVFPLLSAVART